LSINIEAAASLLADANTVKILTTVGKDGLPHSVRKQSLHLDHDGKLRYFELLEHSKANQNMTYSLWFQKPVSVHLSGADGKSFELTGIPIWALISGPEFESAYTALRKQLGQDTELSTVWVIEPAGIRETSYGARRQEEEKRHPFVIHLDRLYAEENK
jgi:hypothetical protein